MTKPPPDGLAEQSYELAGVEALHLHPDNPRRGDVEAIAESVTRNRFYGAVVAQRSTGYVLAGNHRLQAARRLGLTQVPVLWLDVDDAAARRVLLADNRTNDLAAYDDQALVSLLRSAAADDELPGTGYQLSDLDRLESRLGGSPVEVPDDADDAPAKPAEPVSRPGDLWQLGPHRLVVGDATDPGVWEALLGTEAPDAVWTDPPYGVAYAGKTAARLRLENDDADLSALEGLLRGVFTRVVARCGPGAPVYVAAPPGPATATFASVLTELGLLRQTLVWVKDEFVMGHSDYHYRHEIVYFGYTPAQGRVGRGSRGWMGGNRQDSVLEVARPRASREHPTMKPAGLVAQCVVNSTRPGAVVADPCAGSGSTMVACHLTGRHARLIELDPRFADVACWRYQARTGESPVRPDRPTTSCPNGSGRARLRRRNAMGKRGPRPMPTNVRVLHGDRKDRINTHEPSPDAVSPEPPADLASEVRQVWAATARELAGMGLAFAADADALRCYCEAVVTHRRASQLLASSDVLVKGLHGKPVRNPVVQIQRDAAATVRAFAQEFGLTPSARSTIALPEGDRDPKDDLLTG